MQTLSFFQHYSPCSVAAAVTHLTNWLDKNNIPYSATHNKIQIGTLIVEVFDLCNPQQYTIAQNSNVISTLGSNDLIALLPHTVFDRFDAITAKILHKLDLAQRKTVRPSKCVITDITQQAGKDFLDQYHLSDFHGTNCVGVFHESELVAVMSYNVTGNQLESGLFASHPSYNTPNAYKNAINYAVSNNPAVTEITSKTRLNTSQRPFYQNWFDHSTITYELFVTDGKWATNVEAVLNHPVISKQIAKTSTAHVLQQLGLTTFYDYGTVIWKTNQKSV